MSVSYLPFSPERPRSSGSEGKRPFSSLPSGSYSTQSGERGAFIRLFINGEEKHTRQIGLRSPLQKAMCFFFFSAVRMGARVVSEKVAALVPINFKNSRGGFPMALGFEQRDRDTPGTWAQNGFV